MIRFVIPGPAVGKGRPKFARRGNFVKAYTPEKTASYENLVKLAASAAMNGREPVAGAVQVEVFLFVSPPASWSKKKKAEALGNKIKPTTKPDVDNVLKSIADALNGIVFVDDKQITDAVVRKRYSESSSAVVEVREL